EPHDQFDLLRREAPVFWHRQPDDTGFWALTKHADVKAVSHDHHTFSTEVGSTFILTQEPEALELARLTLLNMDPPKHNRYRRLVSAGFTPRTVGHLRESIEERARLIIDNIAERGEAEFVEDIAAELPLEAICEMVGVPDEDRHLIFNWSNRLVGFQDPDFRTSLEDGQLAAAEIYAYCDAIAADRRANPRDDIMSTLVHAEIDGDRLTDTELDLFFVLLCVAGNETTRNLISLAMLAVIEHPEARAALLAGLDDDALWATATEEFLRWGSSIHNFRRTATCDTEVRGVPIKEGDKVVTFYLSANRDEDVFPDPYRFDIRRHPNEHVTFGGGGLHFCLGANLARAEISSILRAVLRRLPDIELAGPIARMRSDFINGIKSMPVRFTPS
ncbi:MAG: cytochrome P450, partial [Acidimicrobiales bacterium]